MADSVVTIEAPKEQRRSAHLEFVNSVDASLADLNGLCTSMSCVLGRFIEEDGTTYDHPLVSAMVTLFYAMSDKIEDMDKAQKVRCDAEPISH